MDWIPIIVGMASLLSGAALGWWGRAREIKRETRQDAEQDATIRSDIEYIKRGVDDLKYDVKSQKADFNALVERVARVEESYKSLHKRVDRLEGRA